MEAKERKGTTTIGLLAKDGVVLASERRATMGYLIANKETQKIFEIQPYMWLTTAGSVADAQTLVRLMKVQTNLYEINRGVPMSVTAAATLLSNILYENRTLPYYVQLLLGGYDTEPRLYSFDALGSVLPEKVVATGSGSPIAYGVLEEYYKKGKSVDDNAKIAIRALKAAMQRDVMSGNGVDVVKITANGAKLEKYELKDLEKI